MGFSSSFLSTAPSNDEISDNSTFVVYFIACSLLCCRFFSEGDPICVREIKSGVTLSAFMILWLYDARLETL
jgi:hypothetical protein